MYYLSIAGKTLGPYDQDAILSGLREGRIPRDAMVCPVGSQQWQQLDAVPEFAGALPPPPPPPPPATPSYARPPFAPSPLHGPYDSLPVGYSSNRVAAGVCGILLGALGIHKFILGMTTPGMVMLLVSILTCGVGAFPMAVIGLVEGIVYLTKSEEEFYQLYVMQKKEWF
jgi:TM2 domain-containing membrane protein YozV